MLRRSGVAGGVAADTNVMQRKKKEPMTVVVHSRYNPPVDFVHSVLSSFSYNLGFDLLLFTFCYSTQHLHSTVQ